MVWLKAKFREYGPNKTKGYHKAEDLVKELQIRGHSKSRILNEVESLSAAGCINTESQTNDFNESDLVSIAPSGFVHLDMLRDINYLSTVSEDTLFRENQIAKKISDNITGIGKHKAQSRQSAISNSRALVNYMNSYFNDYFVGAVKVLEKTGLTDLVDLEPLKLYVESKANSDKKYHFKNLHEEAYPSGTEVIAQIVSVQNYGVFVEFDLKGAGLIHKSNFTNVPQDYLMTCEEGDWIVAEIIRYNTQHNKFDLKLVGL